MRFDLGRRTAYITDSGVGGIVVVDLATGESHRALDRHPSVLVEEGVDVVVEGEKLLQFGKPPQFQSDGIALSPDRAYLYYKPVTGKSLYRIPTAVLRERGAAPADVAAAVERVAQTFPTDGLWFTADGNLYLTDVESNAVTRLAPDGSLDRVIEDHRLQWPDTSTEGPDGAIYVSASHINESANFNEGKPTRTRPYGVYKFMP